MVECIEGVSSFAMVSYIKHLTGYRLNVLVLRA